MTLVEEPHRLLITTPDQADKHLVTEVYPVADLLLGQQVAGPPLLADPYLDCEEAARARIRSKLQRPMTVAFEHEPLVKVIEHFAKALDDVVFLDRRALEEASLEEDTPVDANWHDVPAKESLRWILDKLKLDYMVDHEALIITTPDRTERNCRVRLHSGCGIVHKTSPEETNAAEPQIWGMGGFGGGMGGMMGGMGGSGDGPGAGGMGGGSFGGGPAASHSGSRGGVNAGPSPYVISVIPTDDGSPPAAEDSTRLGEEPEPAEEPPEKPESPASGAGSGALALGIQQSQLGGAGQRNLDGITDLLTSTIRPTAWNYAGGPSSIEFFEPSLAFVINATDEGARRGRGPVGAVAANSRAGGSQARDQAHPRGSGPDGADYDFLIDLITSTVKPTSWDSVGGPGSIAAERSRRPWSFRKRRMFMMRCIIC